MADVSITTGSSLDDAAYRAELGKLLAMIRAAPNGVRAQSSAEQRLALLRDPRALPELARSGGAPGAAWRTEGAVFAAALSSIAAEQIDPPALATLWLLWVDAEDNFRREYGLWLDPLFSSAVEQRATALGQLAPKNHWFTQLIAARRAQAAEWTRGWVAALLAEGAENLAALEGGAAMLALVQRARRRLTPGLFRLDAAVELHAHGGFDLMLAFWAWAQREAISLVLDLQRAHDAIIADILLRRAIARLQQWRAEAEAAGLSVAADVGALHVQLMRPTQAATLPLPALLQVGRVKSTTALYNLVCEEPWLLMDAGMITGGAAGNAYMMLDPAAEPRQIGQNFTLLGQLRASGVTPAANPVAAVAQRVFRRETTVATVLAAWQRGNPPDLLQVIAAAAATADLCDRNNKLGTCQAEICYHYAATLTGQPILKLITTYNYAYARFGEGETVALAPLLQRACESARQLNHAAALISLSDLLGQIYAAMGELKLASAAFSAEIMAALALPYRPAQAGALLGMADLCRRTGELDQLEVNLDLLAHYGVPEDTTVSAGRYWALQAYLQRMRGKVDRATDCWARAARLAVTLLNTNLVLMLKQEALAAGRVDDLLGLLATMRDAADRAGDPTLAAAYAAEYLQQANAAGHRLGLQEAQKSLADLSPRANLPNGDHERLAVLHAQIESLLGQMQANAALPLLNEADLIAQKLGDFTWLLSFAFKRAHAMLALGDTALVRAALEQIAELHERMPASSWTPEAAGELALIQVLLGEEYLKQGRVQAAERCFNVAEGSWRAIMLDENVALDLRRHTMENLRAFYRQRGDRHSLYMLTVVWAELTSGA